jgi:hypothetical protein
MFCFKLTATEPSDVVTNVIKAMLKLVVSLSKRVDMRDGKGSCKKFLGLCLPCSCCLELLQSLQWQARSQPSQLLQMQATKKHVSY